MIGANEDLDSIPKQFISVDELLQIFADCEKTTIIKSAQWFVNNIQILNRTKKLILRNSYTLVEYEYNGNNFYNCPIKTIKLIAEGEDVLFADCVGFARYRVLKDLKKNRLEINDDLIKSSSPYKSKICYADDDNFYKNQCDDLIEDLKNEPKDVTTLYEIEKNNHVYLLDKNNPSYNSMFALLFRVNHDLISNERFSHKATKLERVKDCLEEYAHIYNIQPSATNITHIANLIKVRDKARHIGKEAMTKILIQKQK